MGPLPGWAARRLAADPEGKRCICCAEPIALTGPHALRMMNVTRGRRCISWCRTCDPWSDAARGIKLVDGRCVYGPMRNDGGWCLHPERKPKEKPRRSA